MRIFVLKKIVNKKPVVFGKTFNKRVAEDWKRLNVYNFYKIEVKNEK